MKDKLENLPTPEPGGGDSNLPVLPAGTPYWSFLGVVPTVAEVQAKPTEGFPDYSYVLCLGDVWAIIEGAWVNRGSFMALGGGTGTPEDPNFPNTRFLGVLSSVTQLEGLPASSVPEYGWVMIKGHVHLAMSGQWNDIGSFESGEGGGGSGGGTPFPEAPIDGLLYGRQNGDWALINTEAKKSTDLGNTPVIDPNKGVFYKLDNTMPDAKTITLKSGPGMVYPYEDYAITVALLVNGIAGELIFKTENGAVLYWHKGVQPILYAQRTTIILLWTGDEWMGSTGAQIP